MEASFAELLFSNRLSAICPSPRFVFSQMIAARPIQMDAGKCESGAANITINSSVSTGIGMPDSSAISFSSEQERLS